MAGVWNFSVLQLYSLDSSFAKGLARSAVLSFLASCKIISGIFGLQNRSLGLKNRHLGGQNRFLRPPTSLFGCSWPLPSHFDGFGGRFWMDFGGPGLGNQGFFVVKTNTFGQPPFALPGAEALSKICKKPRKN